MAKVDLADLAALMDARTRASQTKLRQIMAREVKLGALLAELTERRKPQSVQRMTTDPTTLDYQNELRHLRWVDQRRAMINIELAQVRAMADIARQDLKQHFARQNALDRVISKQDAISRRIQERRSTYGS